MIRQNHDLLARQSRGGLPLLFSALIIAFFVWFFLFSVENTPFWLTIAVATFVLGGATLIIYPDTLHAPWRSWGVYLSLGIAAAIVLYGVFAMGFLFARLFPFGLQGVEGVYSTRSQASPHTIELLLLFIIGPGEELFWRAWVQRTFANKFGAWRGFFLMWFMYTGVHLPSLNLTLIAAAAVAGGIWGLLYLKVRHIAPGIISHALWDAAVFVWFPFT